MERHSRRLRDGEPGRCSPARWTLKSRSSMEKQADKTDENGRRLVVRNGHMPERELTTGIGPVRIKQPRVDDRKLDGLEEPRFTSAILPRYMTLVPVSAGTKAMISEDQDRLLPRASASVSDTS